ncbi:MAG: hypothetical protein FJY92_09865 [Candidatus Hydrogenedentes bacterium]|nr:hypothetical protein [Candidatus Hydrogenedentota bacterium]
METLLLLIPLLAILVTLAYGVAQVLIRAWLDYRVRLAFLDKLEKDPALLGPHADMAAVMSGLTSTSHAYHRQNYATTGLVLTAIGIASLVAGRLLRSGEFAVGIYLGGVLCIVLGLVIALVGSIARLMSRPSAGAERNS